MQRTEDGGVIISCDFCGTDWEPQTGLPFMTEGHRGSVICLACVKLALQHAAKSDGEFPCTLCLQERSAGTLRWSNPSKPAALACAECINQAARVLGKDPDVGWKWDGKKLAVKS